MSQAAAADADVVSKLAGFLHRDGCSAQLKVCAHAPHLRITCLLLLTKHVLLPILTTSGREVLLVWPLGLRAVEDYLCTPPGARSRIPVWLAGGHAGGAEHAVRVDGRHQEAGGGRPGCRAHRACAGRPDAAGAGFALKP